MKLWLLRPKKDGDRYMSPWRDWYDKAFGFVVRAETEIQARELAASECGDEKAKAWTEEANSTCVPLTENGDSGVILRDFWSA